MTKLAKPEDLISRTAQNKRKQIYSIYEKCLANKNDPKLSDSMKTKLSKYEHLSGIILSSLAGFAYAMTNIISRRLSYISSTQLTMQCCGGMILSNLSIMIYKRIKPTYTPKINLYLFLRAVITAIAYNCVYLALTFITVADMSVIGSCSPIITTIFARVGLKESCGVIHVVCLILSFIGILLVSKLPLLLIRRTIHFNTSYLWGILIAASSTLCFAVCNIFPRISCMLPIHYSVSVFYIGIAAVVGSGIVTQLAFRFTLPHCGIDRLYVILHAVMGSSTESLLTIALQYEQASVVVMIFATTNITVSFVWQTLAEGLRPDVYTTSGAIIVIFCVFLICARNKVASIFLKLKK